MAGKSLDQVLTGDHINQILLRRFGNTNSKLVRSEVKSAAENGICGFLGDHLKAVLHVEVNGSIEKVDLFIKMVPVENKPKAAFINQNNIFRREELVFSVIEEMNVEDGPHPWCVKPFVFTESLVVMPDLTPKGYRVHPLLETLDLPHLLLTSASVARFHAAFANFETKKLLNGPYNFYEQYKHLLIETTYTDTPFVRTAAKLSADFLEEFSSEYTLKTIPNLEAKLAKLYVDACDTLDVTEGTWNVLLHKDLWNNNILFQYKGDEPTNAILIDFQSVRFGPPAFDLTTLLYLTTSRKFREEHYKTVIDHYYKVFSSTIDNSTKERLESMGYNESEFKRWCDKGMMFGAFLAIAICPSVLMEPNTAKKVWDDPETYDIIINHDRSAPTIDHAIEQPEFRHRLLEVTEEFMEKYFDI